ncbi:MAG: DUF1634 domain-containing protein [Thermoplasmata archaeon]|nr:DUF1634 domain-containing protein [Thermoplasmata archaeon]
MTGSDASRSVVPPPEPPGLRDAVGHLLRVGVLVSGIFLFVGFLLAVLRGTAGIAGSVGALPLRGLVGALGAGDPWAYLFVGVAVLAATPVIRVALALESFARVRDRPYVLITGFVLLVLLSSLAFGVVS